MSKTVQWKRGNTSVNSTYVGAQGEITVNTDNWNLHVHDGLTPGGYVIDSSNGGGSYSNLTVTGNISAGNLNVAYILNTNTLVATGNITAPYFIGNGSLLTGIASYSNSNVVAYGQAGWSGNIIPAANAVYTLGNITNQWANLWVADNTIYIGNIALGINNSNILTINSEPILSNNSNTTIGTTGNITAGNLSAYRITGSYANVDNVVGVESLEFTNNNYIDATVGNANLGNISLTGNATIGTFKLFGTNIDNSLGLTISNNDDAIPVSNAYIEIASVSNYNDPIKIVNNFGGIELYTYGGLYNFSNTGTFEAPGPIVTSGNVSGNYFIGNGSLLTGVTSYSNADVVSYGDTGWSGNIIPSANNTYTLGNITNQWANLWVANNTIYIGNIALGINESNVLTVNGQPTLTNDSNTTINTDGNLTAGNLSAYRITSSFGNITNLLAVDSLDFTNGSEIDGTTGNASLGNILLTGNITSGNSYIKFVPNSSGDGYGSSTIELIPETGDTVGPEQYIVIDPTSPNHIHIRAGGTQDNSSAYLFLGGENSHVQIASGENPPVSISSNNQTWTFGTDGTLTLPSSSTIKEVPAPLAGNAILLTPSGGNETTQALKIYPTEGGDGDHVHLTANGGNTELYLGNDSHYVKLVNGGNVEIRSGDMAGNTAMWSFGTDGNLTTSSNLYITGNITGANVVSANTFVSNAFNVVTAGNLSITSQYGLGFTGTILEDNGTLELIANGGGSVYVGWDSLYGNGLGNIATINFNEVGGEDIVLRTGNRAATEYNWNFDSTGNLTLPTEGYLLVQTGIIGAGASPAPTLSGFSSIATTGVQGNISASGNLLAAGYANITGNINGSGATFSGNVTAQNFVGNISITGNVQGTTANVTLVAGSYSTVFDNTGTATFPGNIVGNTAGFAIGYRDIPQVSFTGDATLAATAAGKHYYSTLATGNTLTIANNTLVSWSVGTAITVVNRGTGNITVAQGSGVSLYLAGNSTAGNRTVTTYGMVTLLNVAANVWMINGTGVV